MSGADALGRFRAAVRTAVPRDRDLVAELIADRRAESDPIPAAIPTTHERSPTMTNTHLTLAADGSLTLPDELRHELGLTPGETLVIESDGDSLLVRRREPNEVDESAR